jgi:hypothetical protein
MSEPWERTQLQTAIGGNKNGISSSCQLNWIFITPPRVSISLCVLTAECLLIQPRGPSTVAISRWSGHVLAAVVRPALTRDEPAQIEVRQVLGPEGFFF